MSNLWFTSDTHWGHSNVIRFCNRPYKDVTEMDEALILNWNERVKKGDIVYHLGDFTMNKIDYAGAIRKQLNGEIHLIYGNHDKWAHRLHGPAAGFQWVGPYKEIKVGEQKIILMHYAMLVWNRSHHGSWQLHGHSHGSLTKDPTKYRMDVGVDPNNYRPISFDEVAAYMKTIQWKAADYHGKGDEE